MATRKFRRKRSVLRKTQRKTNRKRIKRKNKTRKQKGGSVMPAGPMSIVNAGLNLQKSAKAMNTRKKKGKPTKRSNFMSRAKQMVQSITPNRSRRQSATPNEIHFEVLSKTLPRPEKDHLEIGCPEGFRKKNEIGYIVLEESLQGLLKKMKKNKKNYKYKMGLMAFDGTPLLEHNVFNNNDNVALWIKSISEKLMEDVDPKTLDRKELGVIFFCIKIKKRNPHSILDELFLKHLRVCEYDKVRGVATVPPPIAQEPVGPVPAPGESKGGDGLVI